MNVYAVKDKALEAFQSLMVIPTDAVAIRTFGEEVNNPGSQLNKHPQDYDLYKIGVWNDRTGEITENTPTVVIRALQLKGE